MSSKIREAIENSNGLLEELMRLGEWSESAREQIKENKTALAEPLRNCDVGTAEEQSARYAKFCYAHRSYEKGCGGCPLCGEPCCELAWAQMPYEEAKG